MTDTGENAPSFPPLFRGEAALGDIDPFNKAIAAAVVGVDPGLIIHNLEPERMRVAMILAPETPLEDAMAMVFATELGFADSLGALAPPEVGVHVEWPATLRVNGGKCGKIRAAASTADATAVPDWLVIGLELAIFPIGSAEGGEDPETTSLVEEGCGEIPPTTLLESWSRHTLVWINRWLDEGMAPLHGDWRSRAHDMGKEVSLTVASDDVSGTFVGLDEAGGMLLRAGDETRLFPLSLMLEK